MNEKTTPVSRRRFEVEIRVVEVVDNPAYYDPYAEQNFRSTTTHDLFDAGNPKFVMKSGSDVQKTIKKDVGYAEVSFDFSLLEFSKYLRDGAMEAMLEDRVKNAVFACIVDKSFGIVTQLVKWFKRNPS